MSVFDWLRKENVLEEDYESEDFVKELLEILRKRFPKQVTNENIRKRLSKTLTEKEYTALIDHLILSKFVLIHTTGGQNISDNDVSFTITVDGMKFLEDKRTSRRQFWYATITLFATLVIAYTAWNNFVLQQPDFHRIAGTGECPDSFSDIMVGYGLTYEVSYINRGGSGGSIAVAYENNSAEVLKFSSGNYIEKRNSINLFMSPDIAQNFKLEIKPFYNQSSFNFTFFVQTKAFCEKKTCIYNLTEPYWQYKYNKIYDSGWTDWKC